MSINNPIAGYVEGARLAPLPPDAPRRAMSRLANAGEAADPLVFVGRRREIARIAGRAEALLDGAPFNPRCSLLFQGAPRSGVAQRLAPSRRRRRRRRPAPG